MLKVVKEQTSVINTTTRDVILLLWVAGKERAIDVHTPDDLY